MFSPIGSGLDCHRHYEALAFGALPLVDLYSSLVPLFASLPVVFVANWSAVTATRLEGAWAAALARRRAYDYRDLRRDAWARRILAFRYATRLESEAARVAGFPAPLIIG